MMSPLAYSKSMPKTSPQVENSAIPVQKLIEVGREAAFLAGDYLKQQYDQLCEKDISEKAQNDFVTYVDTASEKIIIDHILGSFPGHSILSEESEAIDAGGAYRWIIDPLDGTRNYIQKIPFFAVSIAVTENKQPVAGVVLDVAHGELFHAMRGKGAFLNDEPIEVSKRTEIRNAVIGTGFPHRRKETLRRYLSAFEEIFRNCSGMRRIGAAALDLCYVACGRLEGFFELGLSPWDVAAGALIAGEAGGSVTDFWGQAGYLNSGYVVAGNPAIHSELTTILAKLFEQPKETSVNNKGIA